MSFTRFSGGFKVCVGTSEVLGSAENVTRLNACFSMFGTGFKVDLPVILFPEGSALSRKTVLPTQSKFGSGAHKGSSSSAQLSTIVFSVPSENLTMVCLSAAS